MKHLSTVLFWGLLTAVLFSLSLVGCGGTAEPRPLPTPIIAASVATYEAGLERPPTPPVTPPAESGVVVAPSTAVPTFTPVTLADAETGWHVGATGPLPAALQTLPPGFIWTAGDSGDLQIVPGGARPFFRQIYALAAPFPTLADGLALPDVQAAWLTGSQPLFVTPETAVPFTALWGPPGPGVQTVAAGELVDSLWAQRPSLAIVPFEQLEPRLKVLAVDGRSPLAPDFDSALYPLAVDFGLEGNETAMAQFRAAWNQPTTNREADKLTRLALTGVTALVRATAFNMEQNGILWPGEDVAAVLQAADFAHVSNEVSFAPDCPYPNPIGDTTFCSRDSYFELLTSLGIDLVELTGNHLNDWGRDNLLRTIEMYDAAGMLVYGGGRDAAQAAEPALLSHNGNRVALVGCNSFGPAYAWATAVEPGARPCDDTMAAQIGQLVAEGYLVIVTLQAAEYYEYAAPAAQAAEFQAWLAAGATAVSGSQGHHAQGFAFHNGDFIHYGVGNLFFDQMDMLGTRQTFVDTYTVYDGRLLNVDLWTGLIENYARPRLMTPEERAAALTAVFQASGW